MKDIMKEINLKISPKTSYEELLSVISLHQKFESISEKNRRMIYDDIIEKLEREGKKKEKEGERRKKKDASKFLELLESLGKKIPSSCTYAEVKGILAEYAVFKEIENDVS
jgi:hypothetical protein